jgi:hypothetical protein
MVLPINFLMDESIHILLYQEDLYRDPPIVLSQLILSQLILSQLIWSQLNLD